MPHKQIIPSRTLDVIDRDIQANSLIKVGNQNYALRYWIGEVTYCRFGSRLSISNGYSTNLPSTSIHLRAGAFEQRFHWSGHPDIPVARGNKVVLVYGSTEPNPEQTFRRLHWMNLSQARYFNDFESAELLLKDRFNPFRLIEWGFLLLVVWWFVSMVLPLRAWWLKPLPQLIAILTLSIGAYAFFSDYYSSKARLLIGPAERLGRLCLEKYQRSRDQ